MVTSFDYKYYLVFGRFFVGFKNAEDVASPHKFRQFFLRAGLINLSYKAAVKGNPELFGYRDGDELCGTVSAGFKFLFGGGNGGDGVDVFKARLYNRACNMTGEKTTGWLLA